MLGHADAGTALEVAQVVVGSLALVAAETAGDLPPFHGPLMNALALEEAPPCRAALASDPQAACGLGTACAQLAAAALKGGPSSGGEALALAAAAMATAGACVGHALAAAEAGRLEWPQLAKLAGAALGPTRSLLALPDGAVPRARELCAVVLEAVDEVRVDGAAICRQTGPADGGAMWERNEHGTRP